jgi:hypothetical protein
MGPNDALEVAPDWLNNVRATLAAFREAFGVTAAQVPAVIVRLAATNPAPGSYPGWGIVQQQIEGIADAHHKLVTPPDPGNLDGLHHNTDQNYTIALDALYAWLSFWS